MTGSSTLAVYGSRKHFPEKRTPVFRKKMRQSKNSRALSASLAAESALMRLMRDESGATSIEYAIIAAGVSIVILGAVNALGANVTNMFSSVATALR